MSKKIMVSSCKYIKVTGQNYGSSNVFYTAELLVVIGKIEHLLLTAMGETENEAVKSLVALSEWQTNQLKKVAENM